MLSLAQLHCRNHMCCLVNYSPIHSSNTWIVGWGLAGSGFQQIILQSSPLKTSQFPAGHDTLEIYRQNKRFKLIFGIIWDRILNMAMNPLNRVVPMTFNSDALTIHVTSSDRPYLAKDGPACVPALFYYFRHIIPTIPLSRSFCCLRKHIQQQLLHTYRTFK